MATTSDVRDILELSGPSGQEGEGGTPRENIMKTKKVKKLSDTPTFKRPEGMHREVYALLFSDNNSTYFRDAPPIIPSASNQGYRTLKAKLGRSKVRPWKFMPFTNPARKDGAIFNHWRRVADEGKDYPFARFNKSVQAPIYSEQEYQLHLHEEGWTRPETDHLFGLCRKFDLRWFVIHDRYDHDQFKKRSIEDLKERYYNICSKLTKIRAPPGQEPKVYVFDADHERRRKEQLERLFNRTPEQVKEEEYLNQELKKIEMRKKEREKKTQDLQKLITAADSSDARRSERKSTKKKLLTKEKRESSGSVDIPTGIKFPDFKQAGVSLRSQRMKLPSSVGQKKVKAIEQLLEELGIDLYPMPTEEICREFNELRSDMVFLYDLKLAYANCEFELQTLRHRFEALAPGKMPLTVLPTTVGPSTSGAAPAESEESPTRKKASDIIDVVSTGPSTPQRKRRVSAADPGSAIKKTKKL
ncbi:DNA methyltransferase 1-associated protein 1-like [Branchiostoma floridae]|uniref:DNA methyltransferase 1-associated protein 1 n=1 Tax=Branchiostoma floridae TaxID=7739 RepID=A0A9J7MFM1_BRAFL|nr:DNA methyltransferase 1-associated protein 1-like [Branchiostoma floridae]